MSNKLDFDRPNYKTRAVSLLLDNENNSKSVKQGLIWCWENLGWRFVCLNGKKPLHQGSIGKNITRPSTLDEVLKHLSQGGNIGLITGSPSSGLLVVDYDDGSVMPDPLPDAPVVHTGGGGLHVYYRLPEDISLGNSTGRLAPHVDTRGEGGCVVCPPSIHPVSGEPYDWAEGRAPWMIGAIPFVPEALLVALQETRAASGDKKKSRSKEPYQKKCAPEEFYTFISQQADLVREASEGQRNDILNRAAYTLGGYAHRGLSRTIASFELLMAATQVGLSEAEALRTFDSGWNAGEQNPIDDEERNAHARVSCLQDDNSQDGIVYFPRNDPRLFAERFLKDYYLHDGVPTLRRWRNEWRVWTGKHYSLQPDEALQAQVRTFVSERVAYVGADGKPRRAKPTNTAVNDFVGNLISLPGVLVLEELVPTWLVGVKSSNLSPLLPCANGLLDISSRTISSHAPSYFNTYSLPFEFSADAKAPTHWHEFLSSLWQDDQASIDLLGEIFGYVLSGDKSRQKIGLIVGPPRSGKGTITAVLTALVGASNVAYPNLRSLAERFGKQNLLDKPLAIIDDARINGRHDTAGIIETLVSVSGEAPQDVERKGKPTITVNLSVRFIVVTNEIPRLPDNSGALASRFLILQTKKSYLGIEDLSLQSRLLQELPGILNWALDGWDRLVRNGRFTTPESADSATRTLMEITSPIRSFADDCLFVEEGTFEEVDAVYKAWTKWCEDGGSRPSSRQVFGRDLHAAFPEITTSRPGSGKERRRCYLGLRLK